MSSSAASASSRGGEVAEPAAIRRRRASAAMRFSIGLGAGEMRELVRQLRLELAACSR